MTFESGIRDRSQILLLTIIKFELINFYPPWNSQKTYGILMISEEIGVNLFIWKMSSNPEMTLSGSWSNSQELCWYQTCAEKAWFTLGRRGPNSEIFLIFALNVDIFRQRLLNVHAQSFNKETGSALQTSPFSPNFYRYILSSKRGNKIFIFFGYLRQKKISEHDIFDFFSFFFFYSSLWFFFFLIFLLKPVNIWLIWGTHSLIWKIICLNLLETTPEHLVPIFINCEWDFLPQNFLKTDWKLTA